MVKFSDILKEHSITLLQSEKNNLHLNKTKVKKKLKMIMK